jgi:hypothetical protein
VVYSPGFQLGVGRRFPLMFALAKSNCPGKATARSILFAKVFILLSKQHVYLQQLKNNKIQNTTLSLVKMIKHPEQLQVT